MKQHRHIQVLLAAVVLVGAMTAGSVGETLGQSASEPQGAMHVPDCIERPEPLNERDGSFLKPQLLLDLERRHDVAPADKAIADELSRVLFDLAQHMMYCSPAPPNRKYILAYCLYGRVLELDETNKAAAQSREMIEDIYKSLGKSLPEYDCR